MTGTTYEVLPPDRGRELPAEVIDALVDLGSACNQASVLAGQADLVRSAAVAAEDAEIARGRPGSAARRVAAQFASSALSYSEQLTVVYAGVAAAYAAYAAQVFHAVAARRRPSAPTVAWLKPSRLIADLDGFVPRLQIPDPASRPLRAEVIAEQNVELTAAHAHLVTIVEQHLLNSACTAFDDPASVGHPGGADIVAAFPAALHRYAAAATWVVGIMAAGGSAEDAEDA